MKLTNGIFLKESPEEVGQLLYEIIESDLKNITEGEISFDYIEHIDDLYLNQRFIDLISSKAKTEDFVIFKVPGKDKVLDVIFNIEHGRLGLKFISKYTYIYEIPFIFSNFTLGAGKDSFIFKSPDRDLERRLNQIPRLISIINNFFHLKDTIAGNLITLDEPLNTINIDKKTYICASNLIESNAIVDIRARLFVEMINILYDTLS